MSEKVSDGFFPSVIKGIATAVIVTLVSILIFAFIIKVATLNASVIKAVNQFIKILSVFLGCFSFIRGKQGLLKGCLVGLFTTVIIYLLFSLIGGAISFGTAFIIDIVFGLIVGSISGIIAVNVKKD